MHSSRQEHDRVIRFAVVVGLFLVLPLKFGVAQEQGHEQAFAKFACQDQTVKVVPVTGTDPKAIYLCAGNKVTWDANGHTFIVVFKKKSPFVGNQKIFDNNHYQSNAAKNDSVLTVYNYDIIVDGEPIDDPQVVGGGGH